MRILVVGAGSTGGFFGLRLVKAGRDVTFLVRPDRAAALRERGLRIVGVGEEESIDPNLVTAEDLDDVFDLVLLSVKATALDPALEDLAPAVGSGTRIVPFLNGISHLERLNERFGSERVLGGVVKVVTQLDSDGDIVQMAPLATMDIGAQDGGDSPLLREAAATLSDAGFDFSISDDIVTAMWHKWVGIATVGALTCLMRGTIGDVVGRPGGAGLGPAILAEAAAVSAALGRPLPSSAIAEQTAVLTAEGSPFTSSLYRDLVSGAGTEAEPLLGDLVARARQAGAETPLLDLAVLHLRVYEARRLAVVGG